jgi:hypothetical protein
VTPLFEDFVDASGVDAEGLGDVVMRLAEPIPFPNFDRVVEGQGGASAS